MSALSSSKLQGSAAQLCAAGSAVEFIQPWYTPIATTPSNTGMALGGIGNSYTLTPAGTTPVLSFLPGLHVTGEKNQDIRLQNWYFSERRQSTTTLEVLNPTTLGVANDFFPLVDAEGNPFFGSEVPPAQFLEVVEKMQATESLYADNKANLEKYETELSPRTQKLLAEEATSLEARTALLLDYYAGAIGLATSYSTSLTGDLDEKAIAGINTYPSDELHNQLLYPLAELTYGASAHAVKIKRTHFSPIVRNNARLCSLPANMVEIELENTAQEDMTATLLWTQENMTGFSVIKNRPGVQDAGFVLQKTAAKQSNQSVEKELEGGKLIAIQQSAQVPFGDFKGMTTLGLLDEGKDSISISRRATYYATQEEDIASEGLYSGRLNEIFDCGVYSGREATSSALCVEVKLKAGEKQTLKFVQILDYAEIELQQYKSLKKYTTYFSKDLGERSLEIATEVINGWESIKAEIAENQAELLKTLVSHPLYKGKEEKADTLLTLALNTLSFDADATVWDAEDRFLVRECADYPFFNSLDVYFYGSFALLWLLPEVDTRTMEYFSKAVLREDDTNRRFYIYCNAPTANLPSNKYEGPRARRGAVIHDLGSPFDPLPDAYNWHNVAEWKDLAPKYILMVLRNYHFNQDKKILEDTWESVDAALDYLFEMIPAGHNMPLTNGTDDTFDNLSSFGITLYCGSLWVAGLRAAAKIAELLGKNDLPEKYLALADAAKADLNKALWDEENQYFHFYSYPVVDKYVAELPALLENLKELLPEINEENYIKQINDFIYQPSMDSLLSEEISEFLVEEDIILEDYSAFKQAKLVRKATILSQAGEALLPEAVEILDRESDDSFGDPLLADTYLEMMGLETVTTKEQRDGVLNKAFSTNFKANSPHVGYANLVEREGAPKEAFQAQDIWIGVQYSNATALQLAGREENFHELIDTLYENLYLKSKVPFAAPEGFNSSCTLELEVLAEKIGEGQAKLLMENMEKEGWLLADGRISSTFPGSQAAFFKTMDFMQLREEEAADLYYTLQTTGLKYTAGRYFRPGMVFALPLLMNS